MSFLYLVLAIISILFYYIYFKDIFHPNLIFLAVWFCTCAISCVNLNTYMAPWSEEMYGITIISGIAFWIGSILASPSKITTKRELTEKIEITYTYRFILYFFYIICLTCCTIEWLNGGGRLAISFGGHSGDIKTELDGAIPFIHYGTIFLPYVAVLAYFSWINSSRKKKIDLFIIISIIFTSLFFNLSRGSMLIYILSFLFIYSRYHRLKLKSILFVGLFTLVILIGFMFLRVNRSSIVMTTTDNPYFSIIYSYIATCYANLNDYIIADHPYHLTGEATFAPLWTITGMKSHMSVIQTNQLGVFNASTYLYGFYHDYKMFGIIIFPFLLGYIISIIYNQTLKGTAYWILLLAILQKAIFTPFFGNYFFGEMVILFPFLLMTSIIIFLSTFKIKPFLQAKKN